jgi:hypothetical protein
MPSCWWGEKTIHRPSADQVGSCPSSLILCASLPSLFMTQIPDSRS